MREFGDTPEAQVGNPFRLLQAAAVPRCERCGARDRELAIVRFDSWRMNATRTLCDHCANVLFESFIEVQEISAEQATEGALALVR